MRENEGTVASRSVQKDEGKRLRDCCATDKPSILSYFHSFQTFRRSWF